MTAPIRLRLVVFGGSIVSDWRNPLAISARPILTDLVAMGHDILFLEERNNPWLVGMLKTRGLGPERAFAAAYPAIHHRTYDLPRSGNARRVWFAQVVGTADAILALPGAPDAVLAEIAAFDSKLVVRGVHERCGDVVADFKLFFAGRPSSGAEFGPAVDVDPWITPGERAGTLLIAYDRDFGQQARAALAEFDVALIDESPEAIEGWPSIPEASLGARFGRCATAVVVGDWDDELTWARALRPATHGCHVVAAGSGANRLSTVDVAAVTDASSLAAKVREFHHDRRLPQVPETFSAFRQAETLIEAIHRASATKRRANGI
jgi:hypothetical protein